VFFLKITIMSLAGSYPITIGGLANIGYHLCRNLAAAGHSITYVVGVEKSQATISRIPGLTGDVETLAIPWIGCGILPSSSSMRSLIRLLKSTLARKADVVHYLTTPVTYDSVALQATHKLEVPTVFSYQGRLSMELGDRYSQGGRIGKRLMRIAYRTNRTIPNLVVVPSSHMLGVAMREGYQRSQMAIIPNGVDLGAFGASGSSGDNPPIPITPTTPPAPLTPPAPPTPATSTTPRTPSNNPSLTPTGPSFLFVGRLEEIKGVDILIKAFSEVLHHYPTAHLDIVGSGRCLESLERQAKRLGIAPQVAFHGFLASDRIGYYQRADVCVFPSRYEPFGIVVLEAMAAGRPVIASATGGIPELVEDGQTGLLCLPRAADLAQKMLRICRDPCLARRFAKNGRRKARRFDWVQITKSYEAAYQAVQRGGLAQG
jgi:glycosyltransferase involved in cell wall biosynthesis